MLLDLFLSLFFRFVFELYAKPLPRFVINNSRGSGYYGRLVVSYLYISTSPSRIRMYYLSRIGETQYLMILMMIITIESSLILSNMSAAVFK